MLLISSFWIESGICDYDFFFSPFCSLATGTIIIVSSLSNSGCSDSNIVS